ncbi:hypothetical protein [Streptomyces griseosporeus]|uniref:hypothetical protein n=1 Tax=Streptomyces griseosporeus TaxID=1910 RepID=UPI0036FACCDD
MGQEKTEGDGQRRAAAAREAHEERVAGLHGGVRPADPDASAPPEAEAPGLSGGAGQDGAAGQHGAAGQEYPDWSDRHERVFNALSAAQERNSGQAVHLEDIAATAGLGLQETRTLLHDLTRVQRLVTELAGGDRPDLGPRYEVKPRM